MSNMSFWSCKFLKRGLSRITGQGSRDEFVIVTYSIYHAVNVISSGIYIKR